MYSTQTRGAAGKREDGGKEPKSTTTMANRQTKKTSALICIKDFKEYFRRTYTGLFVEMALYGKESIQQGKLEGSDVHKCLDEVRHSILFLGQINKPRINPEEMPILEKFRSSSANPDAFKTHVPRTTPYSILLEMVVRAEGPGNSDAIKKTLEGLAERILKPYSPTQPKLPFFATVVSQSCFCDEEQGDDIINAPAMPFWGASLSCSGKEASEIMLALNCLFNWHPLVAQAVTFAQNNPDASGILKFPPTVISKAYKHNDLNLKLDECPPCSRCVTLFTSCTFMPCPEKMPIAKWKFGNCAENEAISNLLKSIRRVTSRVKAHCFQGTNCWGKMRMERIHEVNKYLSKRNWSGELLAYIPSGPHRSKVESTFS
ncbi:uncharacterized protein LOC142930523 [Petromyzon marinus]|uniref:uncharacterized protein LOC142930523 n=1 Tax=Petromyzon marinus TaxID=7757 RepID=UPI003F73033A